MLALRLDCSTAALTTHQKVLPIWKLVELKVLDVSDRTRTGISILTSAADYLCPCLTKIIKFRGYISRENQDEKVYLRKPVSLRIAFELRETKTLNL